MRKTKNVLKEDTLSLYSPNTYKIQGNQLIKMSDYSRNSYILDYKKVIDNKDKYDPKLFIGVSGEKFMIQEGKLISINKYTRINSDFYLELEKIEQE
ncbi:MAG: hypothetical protein LBU22_13090 [Dysgonamonadaceae bacterium]|jgi:hypothetical protein|nr:hypothetical protein [Dysgonamonadaceae bacterium]